MGLAFLNKKSWHTGSFKNIEVVWKARESADEEKRRRAEIKKKVVEEKYSDELKKIQVEAGLLPESALNRMEWMYCDPTEAKNNAEEYLMGKPVQAIQKNAQFVKEEELNTNTNEDFVKIQEDPLFQMKKEMERRKTDIKNNPVFMKEIVDQLRQLKEEKRQAKQAKKDKKKKRSRSRSGERHKSKSSRHLRSPSRSVEKTKSSKRHRSRSGSKEKKSKDRKKEKKSRSERDDSSTTEDDVFNEYVKKRLGPMVEFDEETYKLKFKAKELRDNKKVTPEEAERSLQAMKKNAEMYEQSKQARYERTLGEENKNGGGFVHQKGKELFNDEERNKLDENLKRGKHFFDKKMMKED